MNVSPPMQELSRVLKSINDNEVSSHKSHINQIPIAFLPVAESLVPSLVSLIQTCNELDKHYHTCLGKSRRLPKIGCGLGPGGNCGRLAVSCFQPRTSNGRPARAAAAIRRLF